MASIFNIAGRSRRQMNIIHVTASSPDKGRQTRALNLFLQCQRYFANSRYHRHQPHECLNRQSVPVNFIAKRRECYSRSAWRAPDHEVCKSACGNSETFKLPPFRPESPLRPSTSRSRRLGCESDIKPQDVDHQIMPHTSVSAMQGRSRDIAVGDHSYQRGRRIGRNFIERTELRKERVY